MEKTVPTAPEGASLDSGTWPQNCEGVGFCSLRPWSAVICYSSPHTDPGPEQGRNGMVSSPHCSQSPHLSFRLIHKVTRLFTPSAELRSAHTFGLSCIPSQGSPTAHRAPAGGLPPPWCPQSTRSGQLSALL